MSEERELLAKCGAALAACVFAIGGLFPFVDSSAPLKPGTDPHAGAAALKAPKLARQTFTLADEIVP